MSKPQLSEVKRTWRRRGAGVWAQEGEAVSAGEITGIARVIAGDQTFVGVRYRIGVVETNRRRGLVGGTIEAAPGIISALYDAGESAIELGSVLGWFGFVVTDIHRGEIKMTGWINEREAGLRNLT
jgi:hypothetical protein